MEFSTERAQEVLNEEIIEAEELISNPSKVDEILIQVEEKLKAVPVIGSTLSDLPLMIAMIKAIRNLRAQMKVPLGQKAKVILAVDGKRDMIRENALYLDKMAAVDEIAFISLDDEAPKGAAAAILGDIRVYLPLAGLIDKDKEKARLIGEKEKTEKEIARLSGKLNNEGFVSKAPAEVVEKERVKLADAEKKLTGLEETIAILEEV